MIREPREISDFRETIRNPLRLNGGISSSRQVIQELSQETGQFSGQKSHQVNDLQTMIQGEAKSPRPVKPFRASSAVHDSSKKKTV